VSWLAKSCVFVAGVLAIVALSWMIFLPYVVERELRAITGFDFRIAVLTANPFTGRVVVRGLSARNPSTYPAPGFVEVRSIRAEVNVFASASGGRMTFDELDLDTDSIEIIRRRDGRSNAGDFMAAFSRGGTAGEAPVARKGYLVRRLHLRLDRLVVVDYTGSKPDKKAYDLHIDQSYNNVSDTRQILVPDVVKKLHDFGLHHDVAQLLPGEFGTALAGAVGGAAHVGSAIHGVAKKLLDELDQKPKP
jgi:hypothetical protein